MSVKTAAELPATVAGETSEAGPRAAESGAPGRRVRPAVLIPTLLLLAYMAQCAWFIQTQSLTFDEPINIISGLEQWRAGQFSGGKGMNDHPPLARILCTLPAIKSGVEIGDKTAPNPESVAWHNSDFDSYNRVLPNAMAAAWYTRPVNALMGAILGLLLWLVARSLYSVRAAHFVLALFAFSPSLVAHFSLGATNDGALTLLFFAAVFQLWRWSRNPAWHNTILMGLASGGLLICKATSLPFFAIALAFMLVLKQGSIAWRPTEWNWWHSAGVLVIAFLIIWGAYHFHVSTLTVSANNVQMDVAIPNRPDSVERDLSHGFKFRVPLPVFEFVQALIFQLGHAKIGHSAFLLGRSYHGGSPLYFPVAVALKWPTIVIGLFLTALALLAARRTSRPAGVVLWTLFPLLYLVLVEFSKLNLGERYIMPVYPFALLLCGSLWHFTRGRRAVLAVLLTCLAANAADVLRYAPDYLSYFNVFVSPSKSYKLLSDSNVDWGEGLIALRRYQQEHPSETIHLAYFGSVAPAVYGIRAIPLMPGERTSGTVIVSATYLSGQTLPDPTAYQWLLQYPTKTILNHTLHVFKVPEGARP